MPVISVRVDQRTYEALVKMAEARGMSLYSYVKKLLEAQVSSEVSGEVSPQVSCQVSSEVSYQELERKLSELTSKVSYLEEKINQILGSTDIGRAPTKPAKSEEKERIKIISLEWARKQGMNIEEYMARKERQGYICNEANRKVYCIWREDIEQIVVELNSTNAGMGDLERVLSGEKLEIARTAVEAGLMWYDSKEKRWRAPL